MSTKLFYRNPESGILEKKEFADSQLNLLRVSDPIATQVIQGFIPVGFKGDALFPSLRMEKESGRFPAFGKEAFAIPGNLKRAIGEKVQRLQMQSGFIQMSLSEYAEGVGIENRERNEWAGSPDQLVNAKLLTVANRIAGVREQKQAVLGTTYSGYASGNYTSGASLKWATDGDPIVDLQTGWWTVQKKISRAPNLAWFTPTAWRLFVNNEKVLNRLKYSGAVVPAVVTKEMVAALLEVEKVVVFDSTYGIGSANGSDGGVKKSALTQGWIWEATNNACAGVAFVGTGGGIEPSFGYTYEKNNSPVIESYYDNATKSQVWDYEHFFEPAITLNEAGYLIYSIA